MSKKSTHEGLDEFFKEHPKDPTWIKCFYIFSRMTFKSAPYLHPSTRVWNKQHRYYQNTNRTRYDVCDFALSLAQGGEGRFPVAAEAKEPWKTHAKEVSYLLAFVYETSLSSGNIDIAKLKKMRRKALKQLGVLVDRSRDHPFQVYYNYAVCLMQESKTKKAVDNLKHAATKVPDKEKDFVTYRLSNWHERGLIHKETNSIAASEGYGDIIQRNKRPPITSWKKLCLVDNDFQRYYYSHNYGFNSFNSLPRADPSSDLALPALRRLAKSDGAALIVKSRFLAQEKSASFEKWAALAGQVEGKKEGFRQVDLLTMMAGLISSKNSSKDISWNLLSCIAVYKTIKDEALTIEQIQKIVNQDPSSKSKKWAGEVFAKREILFQWYRHNHQNIKINATAFNSLWDNAMNHGKHYGHSLFQTIIKKENSEHMRFGHGNFNPNIKYHNTALHLAAEFSESTEFAALVNYFHTVKEQPIYSRNILGQTPLHRACISASKENVGMLLKLMQEQQISINGKDRFGRTALDLCPKMADAVSVKTPHSDGGKSENKEHKDNTPDANRPQLLYQLLLDYGARSGETIKTSKSEAKSTTHITNHMSSLQSFIQNNRTLQDIQDLIENSKIQRTMLDSLDEHGSNYNALDYALTYYKNDDLPEKYKLCLLLIRHKVNIFHKDSDGRYFICKMINTNNRSNPFQGKTQATKANDLGKKIVANWVTSIEKIKLTLKWGERYTIKIGQGEKSSTIKVSKSILELYKILKNDNFSTCDKLRRACTLVDDRIKGKSRREYYKNVFLPTGDEYASLIKNLQPITTSGAGIYPRVSAAPSPSAPPATTLPDDSSTAPAATPLEKNQSGAS